MINKISNEKPLLIISLGLCSTGLFTLLIVAFSISINNEILDLVVCSLLASSTICSVSTLVLFIDRKISKKSINKTMIIGACFGMLTTLGLICIAVITIVSNVRPPIYDMNHGSEEFPCGSGITKCNEVDTFNEK